MTLGQRIQELRKQAGLSREGLGEALGVSRQAVSKWEGDNGIPELDTLIAMSRLFSITVGQLLGVETPEETADREEEKAPAGFTEEQVEEILRRYVEESRRQESADQNTVGHYPVGSWIIAACAVVAAVIIAVLAIGRVRGVVSTISSLQSQISVLHSDLGSVRNQVGGLSDELRGVIEEQSSLISSFDYEVVSFDIEEETVDLKLTTALKTYTAGSKVRFTLSWLKTDDTAGELSTDPVEGPQFETIVTIPMNFHLDIGVQILQTDGTIQSQKADVVYSGMHPGEFAVQFRSAGSSSQAETGFYHYELDLYSQWPEKIFPTSVTTVITLNDEEVFRQEETILVNDGVYRIESEASLEDYSRKEFCAVCYVTDNYGRTVEFELPGGTGSVGGVREAK
jgi:transcriptional regulator with XRE-family HTH domain